MAREEKTLTELDLQPTANVDRANDYLWTVDTSDTSMSAYGTSKKVKVEAFIGDTGPQGDAATIAAGTTTTGDEGTDASVVNSGTSSAAVFDFTIPKGDTGATGAAGEDAYVYIAYASDASGTDFTNTFNAELDYIAIKSTDTEIPSPSASDFTGLWKNYKGATGEQGIQGEQGEAGASSYTYIAYASDDSGTDFTNTFNSALDYIAIKTTTSPIASPQASDFTGLWKNYKGETGATGSQGDPGLDVNWRGVYSGVTAYVVNDAVFYEGSSYICILGSTGNLPTNATYWDLMAQQGAAGEGSGDVSGPSSATDNAVARFDLTTGKLIQNSTVTVSDDGSVDIPAGQHYLINGSPIDPDVGSAIHSADAKTTPVDADTTALIDSEATNVLKKVTWANIKATLKTYFDTLYNLYVHPNHSGDVTSVADGATTIADKAITNAKMADMETKTYKGRTSATTGAPEDVGVATLKADLSLAKADVGLSNVDNVQQMPISYLDTDTALTANSDTKVASQKAIKAYVDAQGFEWKGAWTTSTAYAVNDTVENNGSGYICTVAHTSGASTEPGVGASWTSNWDLFVEGTDKTMPTGDIVGTTDTQTLTNKTLTNPTINFTDKAASMNVKCDVTLSTDWSLASESTTTIPFDSENYDIGSDFNTSTYKFVAPVAGYYLVTLNVRATGLLDGKRLAAGIKVGSNTVLFGQNAGSGTGNSVLVSVNLSKVLSLSVSDEVTATAFQDTGSAMDISAASTSMSIHLLST